MEEASLIDAEGITRALSARNTPDPSCHDHLNRQDRFPELKKYIRERVYVCVSRYLTLGRLVIALLSRGVNTASVARIKLLALMSLDCQDICD